MRCDCLKKMLQQKLIMFLSALLIVLSAPVFAAEANTDASEFILSADEQAYLQTLQDRPITIAYSYDLVLSELEGKSYGILDPIISVLRNEFGLTVNTVKKSWHDAFIEIENEGIDFYGPIAISDSRREMYVTVDPFFRNYSKIITRVNDPVHSMTGLYNRSIGLLEGSVISRTMQAYLGPNGQTIYFSTMDDMINGLQTGVIDAFATVDNAELEILRNDDIQFEFSIDNFFVNQGLISGCKDMQPLASLLNRYLNENPQVSDEILDVRSEALFHYARESLAGEIAYLQANYDKIMLYSDRVLYPLCYLEDGITKGMQIEINDTFENLTGIEIMFDEDENYPNGIMSVTEKLKTGECMAFVGVNLDIDIWNDLSFEYSPLLWMETLRVYSVNEINGNLQGKTIGAMSFTSDYLGWNNTTGKAPILYYNRSELISALKSGVLDAVFMGEMRFNYCYSILNDYSLQEVGLISTEAPVHMLYGSQNQEFNAIFNESIKLFNILTPQSAGQWKAQGEKYKSDNIRVRHNQQIIITAIAILFTLMLMSLFYMFMRNKQAHKHTQDILADVKEKRQTIIDSINYASKIQRNLLPDNNVFKNAFSDYSVIWKPRDVVGGDIYWIKTFEQGTVLCVCDCTGHGTPGALLTMLVVSALENLVKPYNCSDTADIIWKLEQRLVTAFSLKSDDNEKRDIDIKDGCDLAVLFIANDKSVTLSAGNTNVFVCDGNEVRRFRGQRIYVGEGRLGSKEDIEVIHIPDNRANKFYVASDGLFDQPGGKQSSPFGYKRFGEIILKNHNETQFVISRKIWAAFETYRGKELRVDDFEMITFKP